ncbi:MAG: hypothetical protein U1E40_13070 [Amaricoccus sp.]
MALAYGLAIGVFGASVFLVVMSPSHREAGQAPAPAPAPAPAARPTEWPSAGMAASPAVHGDRAAPDAAKPGPGGGVLPGVPAFAPVPMAFGAADLLALRGGGLASPTDLVPVQTEAMSPLPSFASEMAVIPQRATTVPREPPDPSGLRAPMAPTVPPAVLATALPRADVAGADWKEEPPRPLPQPALPAAAPEPNPALRFASSLPWASGHAVLLAPGGIPADPEVGYPLAVAEAEAIQPADAAPAQARSAPAAASRSPRQVARPAAPEAPGAPAPAVAAGVSERAVEGMLRNRLLGR